MRLVRRLGVGPTRWRNDEASGALPVLARTQPLSFGRWTGQRLRPGDGPDMRSRLLIVGDAGNSRRTSMAADIPPPVQRQRGSRRLAAECTASRANRPLDTVRKVAVPPGRKAGGKERRKEGGELEGEGCRRRSLACPACGPPRQIVNRNPSATRGVREGRPEFAPDVVPLVGCEARNRAARRLGHAWQPIMVLPGFRPPGWSPVDCGRCDSQSGRSACDLRSGSISPMLQCSIIIPQHRSTYPLIEAGHIARR